MKVISVTQIDDDQCSPSPIGGMSTTSPRAKAVALVVEQEADAIEHDTTITKPVYEASAGAERFWTLVPTEFGGGGGLGIVQAREDVPAVIGLLHGSNAADCARPGRLSSCMLRVLHSKTPSRQ